MIGTSLGITDPFMREATEDPGASVLSLFAPTHRWWRVAVDIRGVGPAAAALVGTASSVLWRGSVAAVPCYAPGDGNAGPCVCSLHAPASAMRRARSLASVVVGGSVRVLSVEPDTGGTPKAVIAVEGPLHVFTWCGGAQDGFTIDDCSRTPRWVIPAAGVTSAFCRSHLRSVPRRLRFTRTRLGEFETRVASSLTKRYGTEVRFGFPEPVSGSPRPLGSLPTEQATTTV